MSARPELGPLQAHYPVVFPVDSMPGSELVESKPDDKIEIGRACLAKNGRWLYRSAWSGTESIDFGSFPTLIELLDAVARETDRKAGNR